MAMAVISISTALWPRLWAAMLSSSEDFKVRAEDEGVGVRLPNSSGASSAMV